jgi:hypothetical protein
VKLCNDKGFTSTKTWRSRGNSPDIIGSVASQNIDNVYGRLKAFFAGIRGDRSSNPEKRASRAVLLTLMAAVGTCNSTLCSLSVLPGHTHGAEINAGVKFY